MKKKLRRVNIIVNACRSFVSYISIIRGSTPTGNCVKLIRVNQNDKIADISMKNKSKNLQNRRLPQNFSNKSAEICKIAEFC
jgi:hypothetical protein